MGAKWRVTSEIVRRRAQAVSAVAGVLPIVFALRRDGRTLRAIAAQLNNSGFHTARGGKWTAMQVKRAFELALHERVEYEGEPDIT